MNITHYGRFGDVYIAYGESSKVVGLVRHVVSIKARGRNSEGSQGQLQRSETIDRINQKMERRKKYISEWRKRPNSQ